MIARTRLRNVLQSRFPLLTFIIVAVVALLAAARITHSVLLFALFVGAVACAVVWGYSLKARRGYPRLHQFGREEYSSVWDALSAEPEAAAVAACGEKDLRSIEEAGVAVAARIVRFVEIAPEMDVAEIGSGVGRVGFGMARLCRSWTGCDVSRNMLRHAQANLQKFQNAKFVLLVGDGLRELPEASFDLLYSTNMLPHLSEVERWRYVLDAQRVLKRRGWLYIDTVALDSPEGQQMMNNNLEQSRLGIHPPYAPIPSTSEELHAYFNWAGFTDVSAQTEGSLLIITGRKG